MLVSIVVAAYNVEKYINRCIDSLINQSYKKIEIIIINDASVDNTKSICDSYTHNKNIILINKDINQGLSAARNSGIEVATGDYITFIDGDDYIEKDTIEKCVEIINKRGIDEVVFASCFDRKDGSSYVMNINSLQIEYRNDEVMSCYYKEALGSMPNEKSDRAIGITPWGRFYKREIIEKNNLSFISERELIYEDLMFFLVVTPYIKSVAIINEPFYHYCENEGSLTQKCDLERFFKVKKMFYYIKEHYKKEIFEDTETLLRFKRLMISYIRLSIMQIGKEKNNFSLIRDVCRDDFTKEVISNYPNRMLPVKQKVFNILLKYKQAYLLHILCSTYKG